MKKLKKSSLLEKIDLEDEREKLEAGKWRNYGKAFIKDYRLYLMLIPIVVFFILWRYRPMIGLMLAFKNYSGLSKSLVKSINMAHYRGLYFIKQLLITKDFWRAFRNTFVISLQGLIYGFPIPIILALFFSEIKSPLYRSITQILSYLPKFVSTVVITTIITMMVSSKSAISDGGIIYQFLVSNGLADKSTVILKETQYFRPIYHLSGIWQGAGYGSIVYFASIMSISPTNYEAAKMDGANKLAQIRYVTLPSMASTLTIMLILRIGDMLQVGYEKVLLLYNVNTYEVADVISTFVLRSSVGDGDTVGSAAYSLATAADLFNSLIAMCLVLGANFISRRVSDTSLY